MISGFNISLSLLKILFTFDIESSCLQRVALQEENGMPVVILAVKCYSAVLDIPFRYS